MYKLLITAFVIITGMNSVNAQELKVDYPSGVVVVQGATDLIIEGYDGTQVVVERHYKNNIPSQSDGLEMINSRSPKISLDMDHKISKSGLLLSSRDHFGMYKIMVPKGMNLICQPPEFSYENNGNISIKNISGEIEVSTTGIIDINLKDVSGPISIATHGNITASISKIPTSGSISFDTYRGFVDVAIPQNASIDVNLSAKEGAIYSNLDVSKTKEAMNLENLMGSVGQGGTSLIINTEAGGNIYMRKN